MALTRGGYSAYEMKEILIEHFLYRTIEREAQSAVNPEAFKRRVYDILHDKVDRISLRVADEIATACGHPEWIGRL